MDWKEILSDIVKKRANTSGKQEQEEARLHMEHFMTEVALPALQDVRAELGKHGQKARLERGSGFLALTTLDPHGHEEFYYSIRVRSFRSTTFAFPEIDTKSPPKTVSRAEVILRSGPASYDVSGFTREQLIRHFLHEYRKWVGWRTAGEAPPD